MDEVEKLEVEVVRLEEEGPRLEEGEVPEEETIGTIEAPVAEGSEVRLKP